MNINLIFAAVLFFSNLHLFAASFCHDLFNKPALPKPSLASRFVHPIKNYKIEKLKALQKMQNESDFPTRFKLEQSIENKSSTTQLSIKSAEFSVDTTKAALEIQKLLMNNPSFAIDSKILSKDKLTLSLKLTDHTYVDLTYIASSREDSRFVFEKLEIKEARGEIKLFEVTKDKLFDLSLEANSELDINYTSTITHDFLNQLLKNKNLTLYIPTYISDAAIDRFNEFAGYFSLFDKETLRLMLDRYPSKLLMAKFKTKYWQNEVYEIYIKQFIKTTLENFGRTFTTSTAFLAATALTLKMFGGVDLNKVPSLVQNKPPEISMNISTQTVTASINGVEALSSDKNLNQEIAQLKDKALKKLDKKDYQYSGPSALSLMQTADVKVSLENQFPILVFEQKINDKNMTIVVFTASVAQSNGSSSLQYLAFPIDKEKYPHVIQFAKDHTSYFSKE